MDGGQSPLGTRLLKHVKYGFLDKPHKHGKGDMKRGLSNEMGMRGCRGLKGKHDLRGSHWARKRERQPASNHSSTGASLRIHSFSPINPHRTQHMRKTQRFRISRWIRRPRQDTGRNTTSRPKTECIPSCIRPHHPKKQSPRRT